MERQFWIDRWTEKRIGFHLAEVNPLLERFWPEVAPKPSGRVIVPLCGKTVDLRWLAERGHEVVGVEFSEAAAKSFVEEQGIAFTRTEESPFVVYRSERISIFVGDFMQFTSRVGGSYELFYDRAAMIALPPSTMRGPYVRQLQSLLTPFATGLLVNLEYEPSASDVPPFSVSEKDVRAHFEGFDIEKLDEQDILAGDQRFQERGVSFLHETVYRLSRTR